MKRLGTWDEVNAAFWGKTVLRGDCLEWLGAKNSDGRGNFALRGKAMSAPRVAWLLVFKQWPIYNVCHTCDNQACVLPEHLFDGTQKENCQDASNKGRLNRAGTRVTKLAWSDIARIREAVSIGVPRKQVAEDFQIAKTTLQAIITGRSWNNQKRY